MRKMSMNKDIWKKLFLLLRVSQKALQLPVSLIFFFFFFSVFLNRPIKLFFVHLIVVVCTCRSILGHTWEKLSGKCSIDLKLFVWEYYMPCALEKIMMAEVSCSICKTVCEVVICDTCDPWYVVCISLFTANSYHSVQRV